MTNISECVKHNKLCPYCGKPMATQEDWERIEPGESLLSYKSLCWDEDGECIEEVEDNPLELIRCLRQQLREATEWRDKESAPRNGAPFLFRWADGYINIVHWNRELGLFLDYDSDSLRIYSEVRGEWLPIPGINYGEDS